eukprot:TRINITY_DN4359_c0_g1_i3.p1 TRINITY_DN4359_c0_g1~~TRINITY_DN4359_c0_g1_i3.p1  ORF type:complete len:207 (+),score=43.33 TRINITY_DN4359_c0_g1_i3:532-1152(+)
MQGAFSIMQVIDAYKRAIAKFQPVWRELELLDKDTWVLSPLSGLLSTPARRIALENLCSLQVSLSVDFPRDIPGYQFLGPESAISGYREKFSKGINLWDPSASVLDNLQRLLGTKFPSKQDAAEDNFRLECKICMEQELEGFLPTKVCDKCKAAFHESCLAEWLQSFVQDSCAGGAASFLAGEAGGRVLFGDCPNGEHKISLVVRK